MFYRVECRGKGIYEMVDMCCAKDDPRRTDKPDGSWLAKIGPKYPDAVSWFTEVGFKKYTESGLRAWHESVVEEEVVIRTAEALNGVVYEDEDQVLVI